MGAFHVIPSDDRGGYTVPEAHTRGDVERWAFQCWGFFVGWFSPENDLLLCPSHFAALRFPPLVDCVFLCLLFIRFLSCSVWFFCSGDVGLLSVTQKGDKLCDRRIMPLNCR